MPPDCWPRSADHARTNLKQHQDGDQAVPGTRLISAARDKTCSLPPVAISRTGPGASRSYFAIEPVSHRVDRGALVAWPADSTGFRRVSPSIPNCSASSIGVWKPLEPDGHRLGRGRDAGFCLAAGGRHAGALSGEDSRRGTFSQRHSVLVDPQTGAALHAAATPRRPNQAPFSVYDSMLSENAVLGFEYGYSLATPHGFDHLGSTVRRFRQRRPGDYRSVHC